MSDEDLTTLIRLASPAGSRRTRSCPDEERLAAYVEGRLGEAPREGVEAHLAGCAFCRGQVAFLVRAEQLGPAPAVPAHLLALARGERSWWSGRLRPAVAMAAAGLAALLIVTSRGHLWTLPGTAGVSEPAPTALPTLVDRGQVRTGRGMADLPRIARPAEGETVPLGAFELRWDGAAGALFYTVQLVDSKGDVVWEGRSEGTRLTVPSGVPLASGQPCFAWVLAHLRSGATVRSAAVEFRLGPE